jgi:hypothetical protein
MSENQDELDKMLNDLGWGELELKALQYLADSGFFGNIEPTENIANGSAV